jgi:hypothetical protein
MGPVDLQQVFLTLEHGPSGKVPREDGDLRSGFGVRPRRRGRACENALHCRNLANRASGWVTNKVQSPHDFRFHPFPDYCAAIRTRDYSIT